MWVAAPILPGTPAYARAQALAELAATPDNRLAAAIREVGPETIGLPPGDWPRRTPSGPGSTASCVRKRSSARTTSTWTGRPSRRPSSRRSWHRCSRRTRARSAAVKRLLLQTAEPVGTLPAIRQGYGLLDARASVLAARAERHRLRAGQGRQPRLANSRLIFRLRRRSIVVAVAGDFNRWVPAPLEATEEGSWRLELPSPPEGRYLYKLLVDGERWSADPGNGAREADPYGGSNSVLLVKPGAPERIE